MDNRRNNLETHFADAGLALLMDLAAETEGELLWEEYRADTHTIPPELDNRCRSTIQKTVKKNRKRRLFLRTWKSVGQAAACLAIVLCLTVSLITSVEALRVPMLNFLLKHSPRATAILFQQAPSQKQSQLEELLSILKRSAPEGYTLELEHLYRDEFATPPVITSVFLAFQNPNQELLTIKVSPAAGSWSVDTENASVTQITLEGQQAILIEKAPENSMLWVNATQGLLYHVTANAMEKTDFMEYVTILAKETRYSNAGLSE